MQLCGHTEKYQEKTWENVWLVKEKAVPLLSLS